MTGRFVRGDWHDGPSIDRTPCRAAPAKGTVQVERNSLPT